VADALAAVGQVQETLAALTPEEQAVALASVELIQPLLALRYPTLGAVPFKHPGGALLMAQLELMCGLIPPSEQVRGLGR